jgi:hypothetical protein
MTLDRDLLRTHHVDFSYLVGRFMVEHLVRVHRAFDGDVIAAIVLGTIGQHNMRLFYDEVVAKSGESIEALFARGAHVKYLRPCNAMSVSASTGIPRETVRRKIRWLVEKGWVAQVERDKLYVTTAVAAHFAEFDVDMIERFHDTTQKIVATMERRAAVATGEAEAAASATGSTAPVGSVATTEPMPAAASVPAAAALLAAGTAPSVTPLPSVAAPAGRVAAARSTARVSAARHR